MELAARINYLEDEVVKLADIIVELHEEVEMTTKVLRKLISILKQVD